MLISANMKVLWKEQLRIVFELCGAQAPITIFRREFGKEYLVMSFHHSPVLFLFLVGWRHSLDNVVRIPTMKIDCILY